MWLAERRDGLQCEDARERVADGVVMYDVAVIGGGPAGATLARMIAGDFRVLVVEKRTESADGEGFGSKCCGGLLAPDAQKMLASLGLGLPQHVLLGPQVFVVRVIDLERRVERYYQRHYINIDRGAFDRWLISLIPSSVDVRMGCELKGYEEVKGGFELRLSENGTAFSERAGRIVGADGARSLVRKPAFSEAPFPKLYAAIQEWVAAEKPPPYFTAIFDREVTDYYSWTIPKDDMLVVGAALSPGEGASENFELLKRKLGECGFELGRRVRKEAGVLLRPVRRNQICTGGNGIGLIGEAAGWISPSSAEGLSYAFGSAAEMASALKREPDNFARRYKRNRRGLRRNVLAKNIKANFVYGPLLRRCLMRTGLGSMRVAGCS